MGSPRRCCARRAGPNPNHPNPTPNPHPHQVLREAGMLCNPRTPASVLRSQRNASLPAVDLSVPSGAEASFDKALD